MREKILLLFSGFILGALIDMAFFYGRYNIEIETQKNITEYVLGNLEQCSGTLLKSVQACDVIVEFSNNVEKRNRWLSIESARLSEHR